MRDFDTIDSAKRAIGDLITDMVCSEAGEALDPMAEQHWCQAIDHLRLARSSAAMAQLSQAAALAAHRMGPR